MTRNRKYKWYLEAKDSHTNEVFAKGLANETISSDNNFEMKQIGVMCADGKTHNLWICTETQAWFLWRSRTGLAITFRIFGQEGNGKIYDKTCLFKHERGSPKKKIKRR